MAAGDNQLAEHANARVLDSQRVAGGRKSKLLAVTRHFQVLFVGDRKAEPSRGINECRRCPVVEASVRCPSGQTQVLRALPLSSGFSGRMQKLSRDSCSRKCCRFSWKWRRRSPAR